MKTRPVEFYSRGTRIVGNICLPDDYKEGRLPCIIPCSGYTGIAAAYPSLLSRLFTKHGYATVTFDYRGWPPSEGEPGHTTAEDQYDDILAAYIFAQQQPEIQPENVALFGWGFAAATVLKIAAQWTEIKAVGCGNGVYNGDRCLRTVLHWEDYVKFKQIVREDLVMRVLTGKSVMVPPYQPHGNARGYAYRLEKIDPLTRQWLIEYEEVAYNKETHSNTGNFMDVQGVLEAIIRDYGGRQNFPPKQTFETADSYLRIDATYDAKKIAPRPVFIVHAIEDGTYPVSEAQAIAKEIGLSCTTCYVKGDHNEFMFDDHPEFARFSKEIIAFYDKALK
jgi:dienelactone hydrolase